MLSLLQQILLGMRVAIVGKAAATEATKGIRGWLSERIAYLKLSPEAKEAYRINKLVMARRQSRSHKRTTRICLLAIPQIIGIVQLLADQSKRYLWLGFICVVVIPQGMAIIWLDPLRGEDGYIRELARKTTADDKIEAARENRHAQYLLIAAVLSFLLMGLLFLYSG